MVHQEAPPCHVPSDCRAFLDVALLDFTGTKRKVCTLTEANTISKMALLACWFVMLVIALLILALGAMPIALLSLGTWEVINQLVERHGLRFQRVAVDLPNDAGERSQLRFRVSR